MLIIFGFLVMLLMFGLLSGFTGGGLGLALLAFIDVPSFLLIVVPLIFFLCASKSGNIIGKYIKTSFKKDQLYTKIELKSISGAIKNTIKFILAIGGFCFIGGIILMMRFLEDRQMLGPSITVSLTGLFYAISVSFFIFFPTQAWAENQYNALSAKEE
jgi:flagellar motor component MotA